MVVEDALMILLSRFHQDNFEQIEKKVVPAMNQKFGNEAPYPVRWGGGLENKRKERLRPTINVIKRFNALYLSNFKPHFYSDVARFLHCNDRV